MRAGTCRAAEPSPEQASGPGHVSASLVAVSSLFAALSLSDGVLCHDREPQATRYNTGEIDGACI